MNKTQEIIDILLKNRGITSEKDREEFFHPRKPEEITAEEFGVDLKQLEKAVKRIKKAIEKNEKIVVYGDYDVDGICATAVLWETLNGLGANVMPCIPDRFTEGYGLNEERIKKLKEEDPDLQLLITVDHGIVAHQKIDFAKTLGLDVVVTDHHQPGETKPQAYAIVHTTSVSGSAVAWVVAREVLKETPNNLFDKQDHLGLVALGTIADVLPLVSHNRSIAVYGLKQLRYTERPGFKALCEEAVVNQKEIDTFHIGFIIAPRLNAAGRIESALDSLRLLCVKDSSRARELSLKLGKINRLRQEKTEAAVKHIEENHTHVWNQNGVPKIIFVHHESYEEGVIGVVAGRLVEKYYRPAIVMSKGIEFSKASARSISGIDIVEIIRKVGEEVFVGLGGHKMAAGFTIQTEKLNLLVEKLTSLSTELLDSDLVKIVRFDTDLEFEDISYELFQNLARLAPFGFGNPEPSFKTKGVQAINAKVVGKEGKHLKMTFKKGEVFEAIGFGMGEWYTKISPNVPLNIVYSIVLDGWNGNEKLQLKLKSLEIDERSRETI